MREILFKAKRIDNGEWVEGYLIKDLHEEEWYIGFLLGGGAHDTDVVQINPDTICQYTGHLDKNGNKIWENDIIQCDYGGLILRPQKGIVIYNVKHNAYLIRPINTTWVHKDLEVCRVIGNIFDDADLIEESEANEHDGE